MRPTSHLSCGIQLALPALVFVVACGGESSPAGEADNGFTERDSAGVVIARSQGSEWTADGRWRLSAAPLVTIGASADGTDSLHQVVAIVPLSDGRFVVGHASRFELLWFDAAGTVQVRAGREGAGPGEFEDVSRVFRLDGDSIVVSDIRQNRLSVFDPDGAFVRIVRLDGGREESERPLVLLSDRTLLTKGPTRIGPSTGGTRSVILRDTLLLGRYGLDGHLEGEVGPFPMDEEGKFTVNGMPFLGFAAFGKTTHFAASEEGFWIGTGDRPEVELHRPDGTLMRIVRWAEAPEPLTDDVVAAWEATHAPRSDDPLDASFFEGLRETASLSETIPTLGGLLVDEGGNLWVEPFEVPGAAPAGRSRMVFASDGRRLGSVRLPDRFRPLAVTSDRVYGVTTNELGVETVQVYRIEAGR